MKILQREDAKAQKVIKYFTGEPCEVGHFSVRYTLTGNCCECLIHRRKATKERYRKANRKELQNFLNDYDLSTTDTYENHHTERAFQYHLASYLKQVLNLEVLLEVQASNRSRLDIVLPSLNFFIECKVTSSWKTKDVQAQVARYKHDSKMDGVACHPSGKYDTVTPEELFKIIKEKL